MCRINGSCESHTEQKAASCPWESIAGRQANPRYVACASIIKTAAATREAVMSILWRGDKDL